MSFIRMARRLQELPPYIFSELNRIKAEATAKGIQLTSLAIGDPDKSTPDVLVKKLQEVIVNPAHHGYSPYEGTLAFRQSVATWFKKRFSVDLDPASEIVALIGSKEGVAHFPVAFCNPGDKCLYPDPGYPIFSTAISLAGGVPIPMPLKFESSFVPDLNELESLFVEHKPKFAILNFPANPTSAVADLNTLQEMVFLAKKHEVILVSDCAYSEIYFNADEKPPSIFQVPGAKDVAIEFHSFSKSYNMTGWRLGFAVGNRELCAGLLKAKTNIDSGPFMAVQEVGRFALEQNDVISQPIRDLYADRRAALLAGLDQLKIEYFKPEATFYVWARTPGNRPSMDFCKDLINSTGLVTTPGIGFGKQGEHFFRLAMTIDTPEIHKAVQRLGDYLKKL